MIGEGVSGFTHEDRDAHELVGRVLAWFGGGVLVAAGVLGPGLRADLGFLTATDMAVAGAVMIGLGAWQLYLARAAP